MKKLLISLACMISISTFAQNRYFEFGIEGGPNMSIIRGNEVVELKYLYKSYFTAGIFSTYHINKTISIKSGIYYEGKGADIVRDFNYPSGPSDYKETASENFEYLTIPVLMRTNFGKKLTFFVNSGPFISILMNHYSYTGPTRYQPETTQQGTEFYKSTEFGISAGVGLSYSFKKPIRLSIECRDNIGLTDLNDLPYDFPYELKTNTINYMIGVSYKFQKKSM